EVQALRVEGGTVFRGARWIGSRYPQLPLSRDERRQDLRVPTLTGSVLQYRHCGSQAHEGQHFLRLASGITVRVPRHTMSALENGGHRCIERHVGGRRQSKGLLTEFGGPTPLLNLSLPAHLHAIVFELLRRCQLGLVFGAGLAFGGLVFGGSSGWGGWRHWGVHCSALRRGAGACQNRKKQNTSQRVRGAHGGLVPRTLQALEPFPRICREIAGQ